MWMTMATKSTCYVIISMTVFFSTCFAVIVTVDDIGDVVEGSETRITCNIVRSSSSSAGIPTVTWNNVTNGVIDTIAQYQGGLGSVQPSYSDRFSVESETTLVIANTVRTDSGTYQCSVTIVDDLPSPASYDVILTVIYLYKPVLSFATPVNEGVKVEMSCSSDANPLPMYTFLKDDDVQQSGGESTFTFQSVSRDNDGSYKCRASNNAGTETSESRILDVQYAPEITPLNNMEVSRGDSVIIRFVVVANPTASYEWTTMPTITDTDNDPETYTFTVSETIDETYDVTLVATNDVGTTQETVKVTVVARITTLMTTTNAFTTLPPSASCGALSLVLDGSDVVGQTSVKLGSDVVLDCQCGRSSSENGFKYEWMVNDVKDETDSAALSFKATDDKGYDVLCRGTAGAPQPFDEVSLRVDVTKSDTVIGDGGLSTGAIVGIVVGIIVMLVILAIVIVIVLKAREDGPSNKSADSAYMDVTWDTKDPNRVNQGKKTAPPINGNSKQEAAKLLESDTPKPSTAEPDPYQKYDQYGDEKAYSRTSYGDDYNDKPDEDDYANSMPVTV